jgi:hypothetical protein
MLCRYVDQGGGKRKGAFAIYLEPWHSDIFDWLDLRKNHGKVGGAHCSPGFQCLGGHELCKGREACWQFPDRQPAA